MFETIIGNKVILNAALSGVKKDMRENGISMITLQLSDDENSEPIPGMIVKSLTGSVVVIDGREADLLAENWEAFNAFLSDPFIRAYINVRISKEKTEALSDDRAISGVINMGKTCSEGSEKEAPNA